MARVKDEFTRLREMEEAPAYGEPLRQDPAPRLIPAPFWRGTRSEIKALAQAQQGEAGALYAAAQRLEDFAKTLKDKVREAALASIEEEERAVGNMTLKAMTRTTWVVNSDQVAEMKARIKRLEKLARLAAERPYEPIYDEEGEQIAPAERRIAPYIKTEY
jgi:hypothetical protein